ncbi:hypothetical protein Aph01nite_26400 [Acrocarpospora phusangensis]|uniref:Uncharacterized protein n=1 Tax=Acrocarpospora phusangensis TaxID=1070424 RepID=A0A919QBJ1_9ACTN|nr:hypothetical protein Aph01nite_26400 [Acrocarpospora phusangensis]
MVVEAAGQDARLLSDLAHGGGLEALAGEQLRREPHQMIPSLRGRPRRPGPPPPTTLPPHRGGHAGVLSLIHALHYEPPNNGLFTQPNDESPAHAMFHA